MKKSLIKSIILSAIFTAILYPILWFAAWVCVGDHLKVEAGTMVMIIIFTFLIGVAKLEM